MKTLSTLTILTASVAPILAQTCPPTWGTFGGVPLVANGEIRKAIPWDPDGPGPMTTQLLIVGEFTTVGEMPVFGGALIDPVTFQVRSLNASNVFYYLFTTPQGQLFADIAVRSGAGIGGTAYGPGRWDGSRFVSMGGTIRAPDSGDGYQFHAAANGDLLIYGAFTQLEAPNGGPTIPANRVARWTGTTWAPLGLGMNERVTGMGNLPNGDLIAVGAFTTAGEVFANRIARWNGSAWSAFGTSGANGAIRTLIMLPPPYTGQFMITNEDFFQLLGPMFTSIDGVNFASNSFVRWTGSGWAAETQGPPNGFSGVRSFSPPGGVFYGISIPNGTALAHSVNGVTTNLNGQFATAMYSSTVTAMPDGSFFHYRTYHPPTGSSLGTRTYIYRWNGTGWMLPGNGLGIAPGENDAFSTFFGVKALAEMPNGDIVAGGYFTQADGVRVGHIARWNGTHWSPLGAGFNWTVNALHALPNGDLLAGGEFSWAGTGPASRIARWNGTAWSPLGDGVNGTVYAITSRPNGEIVVGGAFNSAGGVQVSCIATWNGTAWSSPTIGTNGWVKALMTDTDGSVLVGGSFTTAGGQNIPNLARWTGSSWAPATSVPLNGGNVEAITRSNQGRIAVAGQCLDFSTCPSVLEWTGTNWIAPTVRNPGQLAVAVAYVPNSNACVIGTGQSTDFISALLRTSTGDIIAGSSYAALSGVPVNMIARLQIAGPADLGRAGGLAGSDNILDNNDFVAFINYFFTGDPRADMGRQGGLTPGDRIFDNNDFIVYINAFFGGC